MPEEAVIQRAAHRIAAGIAELVGAESVHKTLAAVRRQLAIVIDNQEMLMGALEDLQQVDADLAAAVTDLSDGVDRIDSDFAALEDKLATGVDAAGVQAEVDKLRSTIDQVKSAKANLDSTDPAAPPAPAPDQPPAA